MTTTPDSQTTPRRRPPARVARHVGLALLLLAVAAFAFVYTFDPACLITITRAPTAVVFVSRDLSTGRFQPYVIRDAALVAELRAALRADLNRRDWNLLTEYGLSTNHVIALCDASGPSSAFAILGDHFLAVDSVRYPAARTMAVLRRAQAAGLAASLSSVDAARLAPAVAPYLR